MSNEFTIQAKKFNGRIYRSWKAEKRIRNKDFIKLEGIFTKDVNHLELGLIRAGTVSVEYFWLNKGYNIFVFFNSDKTFRNFYCNLTSYPKLDKRVLSYIDFDIDVIVNDRFEFKILDFDQFIESEKKYNYSPEIKRFVKKNLDELLELIELKEFPFDSIIHLSESDCKKNECNI